MISEYPAESSWQFGLSFLEEVRRPLDEEEVVWNFDFSLKECCWLHQLSDLSHAKWLAKRFEYVWMIWNVKLNEELGRHSWGPVLSCPLIWTLRAGQLAPSSVEHLVLSSGRENPGGINWSVRVCECSACTWPTSNFVPAPNPDRFVCSVGLQVLSCLWIKYN